MKDSFFAPEERLQGLAPIDQPQHLSFVQDALRIINEFPHDQQNDIILSLFKGLEARRKDTILDLQHQSDALREKAETLRHFHESLRKELVA